MFSNLTHPAFQGILIGIVVVLCHRFKNPDTYLLNLINVFIFIIFSSGVILYFGDEFAGRLVWGTAAVCLAIIYALRFLKKETKLESDYLKILGIVLIACYPLSFYSPLLRENRWHILNGAIQMIIPILLTIYIYDRWILKPSNMKKKFVIVLSAQLLIILISFLYAFVQKGIADDNLVQANIARMEAERQRVVSNSLQVELNECKTTK